MFRCDPGKPPSLRSSIVACRMWRLCGSGFDKYLLNPIMHTLDAVWALPPTRRRIIIVRTGRRHPARRQVLRTDRRELNNRSFESENHLLCCAPFHAQRSALLEYLRAADDHAIGVTRFHRDRGEHLTRVKAGAGRDGLDSRRRVLDGIGRAVVSRRATVASRLRARFLNGYRQQPSRLSLRDDAADVERTLKRKCHSWGVQEPRRNLMPIESLRALEGRALSHPKSGYDKARQRWHSSQNASRNASQGDSPGVVREPSNR